MTRTRSTVSRACGCSNWILVKAQVLLNLIACTACYWHGHSAASLGIVADGVSTLLICIATDKGAVIVP